MRPIEWTTPIEWVDVSEHVPAVAEFFKNINAPGFTPLPALPIVPRSVVDGLGDATGHLMMAQARMAEHLIGKLGRDGLAELMRFPSEWVPFVDWDKLIDGSQRLVRVDIVRGANGPKIVEFNVFCGPGGPDIQAPYSAVLPHLNGLRLECGPSPFVPLSDYYNTLMERHNLSVVALMDLTSHHAMGYPNYTVAKQILSQCMPNYPVSVFDERDYPAEYLEPGGARHVLLHRVFTAGDFGTDLSLLKRLHAGGAHFSNGLEAELCMDKGWLALLCEARQSPIFTQEQRSAIADFLPETFFLTKEKFNHVLACKDKYAFKVRGGYGGIGVYIGVEHPVSDLEEILRSTGLDEFIVQERVAPVEEFAPYKSGEAPQALKSVFAMYNYAGQSTGLMVRSTVGSNVVNASTGAKVCWSAFPAQSHI